MRAYVNSWETWDGNYLEVKLDVEAINLIIEALDINISRAVHAMDYQMAKSLITERMALDEKMAVHQTKQESEDAERESSEND